MAELENQETEECRGRRHRGHKGLYKRGNVWWLRYAGVDGRIIRQSSKFTKFKDAEKFLTKQRNRVQDGEEPEVKRIKNHTFNELVKQYLGWAERQRSFRSKRGFIGQLKDAFGGLPLSRFNSMLIEQYQTERMQRGNKPATINRLLATIKHMFTKAVEWDMVKEQTLKRITERSNFSKKIIDVCGISPRRNTTLSSTPVTIICDRLSLLHCIQA